jgi:hypothetical protein
MYRYSSTLFSATLQGLFQYPIEKIERKPSKDPFQMEAGILA